ncbi:MAG: DUF1326 domain-containing protein [Deltaproteobacteria bacterium]|nr:DUF1326 domain-containing protein [Deltaproteobacteria bacterium]MBW2444450.1 DUF1326 domain-containing protein [Deltaproteobacteria bacterium]
MPDQWTIRGQEYGNCNCDWGCPCQFNAPTTHGNCEAVAAGHIEEGHFNETRLDGLNFVLLLWWPGEIAEGNGRQQVIVDERADAEQREAIRKIVHGESTAPGATHFFVYNSTMSEVLETLYAPIHLEIDVEARKASLDVPGLIESTGSPIVDPNSGQEFHARIDLPNGFEYRLAEMGNASSKVTAGLQIELQDSYGQWNELHMNQDGVIR